MSITTINDVQGSEQIDSRDLIELRDELREWLAEGEDNAADDIKAAEVTVAAIDALETEASDEWPYGAFFIRADMFEDYARELAEDIGAIPDDTQWPCTCIDWKWAARELSMDYSLVSFLGHDYYVR